MASNRGYYIEWLLKYTEYDEEYIRNRSDNTLYNMYNRISQAIPKYIKQILEDQKNNTYRIMYTKEQLSEKTYNFLNELRYERGIAVRRTPKKKTKPKQTQEEYHQSELIIKENNEVTFEDDSKELQIISEKEALDIFGSDAEILSDQEYNEYGYKIEASKSFRLSDEKVALKFEMICYIHRLWGVDSHNADDFEDLFSLTFDEVKELYIELSQNRRNNLIPYEELKLTVERRH